MSFKKLGFFFALLWTTCLSAQAEPGYYLVSTYENEGEKTVDFKYWSVKIPGDPIIRSLKSASATASPNAGTPSCI